MEDIRGEDLKKWHELLPGYAVQYPNFDFALVELPSAFNCYDNNLLIIRRRSDLSPG